MDKQWLAVNKFDNTTPLYPKRTTLRSVTTKDASGIYVLKSESYNTISNKWLWHYWRSQECMSTQAHQQFLCQQTLPTKCVNYFWGNKSYLNKECRHPLYQKNYVSKFCRVSPTIKQRQQIVSHQIRSTNYISTNSVNKFCQPTPIINYVARNSQLSTNQKCSWYLRNLIDVSWD